jgi:hypothetical protein
LLRCSLWNKRQRADSNIVEEACCVGLYAGTPCTAASLHALSSPGRGQTKYRYQGSVSTSAVTGPSPRACLPVQTSSRGIQHKARPYRPVWETTRHERGFENIALRSQPCSAHPPPVFRTWRLARTRSGDKARGKHRALQIPWSCRQPRMESAAASSQRRARRVGNPSVEPLRSPQAVSERMPSPFAGILSRALQKSWTQGAANLIDVSSEQLTAKGARKKTHKDTDNLSR